MEEVVLKIDKVFKQYKLGEFGTGTISGDIKSFVSRLRGKEDPNSIIVEKNDRSSTNTKGVVNALSNISFDVKKGDVLGIIGRNGAGKSTLLKLFSRVTTPTKGAIMAKGRVSSLLEVGTGFHPELTGKENVFLNGAILGMSKQEINSKLDEIVEFSGCRKYMDTPVKRYSSGMKVRLGFAVAAHLEPEILIVDEVLAVGDAEFQKKCIEKIKSIAESGRTVLFVSHNMSSIRNLCQKVIVLDQGELIFEGDVEEGINYYLSKNTDDESALHFRDFKNSELPICVDRIELISSNQGIVEYEKEDVSIDYHVSLKEAKKDYYFTLMLEDALGNMLVFSSSNEVRNNVLLDAEEGRFVIRCTLRKEILKPGIYYVSFVMRNSGGVKYQYSKRAISFEVVDNFTLKGMKGLYRKAGLIGPKVKFEKIDG